MANERTLHSPDYLWPQDAKLVITLAISGGSIWGPLAANVGQDLDLSGEKADVSGPRGHIHPGVVNAVCTESQTISIYSFFSLKRIRRLTGNNLWDAHSCHREESEVVWIGRHTHTWSLVASSRLLTTMCGTRLTTDSSSSNSLWPLHQQEGTDQLLRKQK